MAVRPLRRKKGNRIWKFFLFATILFSLSVIAVATVFSSLIREFKVDELRQLLVETPRDKARETIKIFDSNDILISEFDSGENREYIRLEQVKTITQNAFVCAEDERFYSHNGYDLRSILRAFYRNLSSGDMTEGGSTITQQLARNVYLNSFEKTVTRKLKEILLAIEIEKAFSKKEILEFYLNQVYFGSGAYGLESASKKYFGKQASKLDLAESSMLAGILTSPSTINPYSDYDKARNAQKSVLVKMVDNGFIRQWQMDAAFDRSLTFKPFKLPDKSTSLNYFIDYVKDELIKTVGLEVFYKGGLNVYTTVDLQTQTAAQDAVNSVLDSAEKNGDFGKIFVDRFGVKQPQSSLVAIDVKTGWIRAMVGGRDYRSTQFNRSMSLRAPGSTFKVFVYSAAFEYRVLSPYSYIRSSPLSIGDWNPKEWFRGYFGTITTQYAIQESSNICAIRALLYTGMDKVARMAEKMSGVEDRKILEVPSMALGTVEMKPIEMASAGQTIANLGKHKRAVAILKIVNRKTETVFFNSDTVLDSSNQAISETTAYDMISCLKRVVRYGTGKTANVPGIPCAGKTGTTTNFRDGWFMGFTPKISAAVYVGADSMETDLSFVQNYGSKYSAVIWKEFIRRIPHKGVRDWQEPDPGSWISAAVCTQTGIRPNNTCPADTMMFRKGYIPSGICQIDHNRTVDITVCKDTGRIANLEFCPSQIVKNVKISDKPAGFCQQHLSKPAVPINKKDETKPQKKEAEAKNPEAGKKPEDPGSRDQNPETKPEPKPKPEQKPNPKPQPKPNPKPEPKPNPEPKPDPEPEPQPEPEPEPPPEEYKHFVVIQSQMTSRVNDSVSFSFSHNYPNAARVEMYVNSVFVNATYDQGTILWQPTNATTYTITFYLRDSAGSLLDSRSIQFTVYP